MCRDCGCSLGPAAQRAPLAAAPVAPAMRTETIEVITAILGENDRVAAHNRAHFDERRVLALNLMSSVAEGTFRKIGLTHEQAIAHAKHMAEEQKKPFDPKSVTGPTVTFQLNGTGAVID